jgi:two-component system, cell cycle sensor histidine kinase and response regulator CckA
LYVVSVFLQKMISAGKTLRDEDHILDASLRGKALTENLLGFARKGSYEKKPYDIGQVVSETVRLLEKTVYKGIAIELLMDPKLPMANGDHNRFAQGLMNVCLNAVDAMAGRGKLTITADQTVLESADDEHDLKADDCLRIKVTDTGAGMTEDILAQCVDPFFTTKATGKGTGLGLSMAYGIAREHDGKLTIESQPAKGTTVTFWLPKVALKHLAQPRYTRPQAESGRGTVLLVDDEEQIRSTTRRVLERLGYDVLDATNGKNALDLYQSHQKTIDVVILDLIMPVMDGAEAFAELRKLDPELKILVSSGYVEDDQKLERLMAAGASGRMSKPYTLEELSEKLSQVLNKALED